MPRNTSTVEKMEALDDEARKLEPGHSQEHWYSLAATFCSGATVLDVGAGTGSGLGILYAGGAERVLGIDPLPAGPSVQRIPLQDIRDNAFDIVTCFDVIEHVEDDSAFLAQLDRVAKSLVFLSTPNWGVSKCTNKFHVREYNPEELQELLKGLTYILWSAGANRLTDGVFCCKAAEDADASFCALLRGKGCTGAVWKKTVERANDAAAGIAESLSALTKWSEEWITEIHQVFGTGKTPLDGGLALTKWLLANVRNLPDPPAGTEARNTINTLRHGAGTLEEQKRLLAWAMKLVTT